MTLHKPRIVDVALSLALMQEEIVEASSQKFTPRARDSRPNLKSTYTPSEATTPVSGAGTISATVDKANSKPKWDDKLAALRGTRKAKGLCMKCGDSARNTAVQRKYLSMFWRKCWTWKCWTFTVWVQQVKNTMTVVVKIVKQRSYLFLYCAVVGVQGKKTMRLKATIQQQEMLVLIDSGSSGTFINSTVVQQLGLPITAAPLTHVTVADGGKLTSEGVVENLQWWTQGHCFTTSAKVLQLGYYDMILGMD
jgi:hypothetical protein